MGDVERICWQGQTLAYVVRARTKPQATTFVTPTDLEQQVGFVVYGAGKEIPRHVHSPIQRNLNRTSEVLIVRSGSCEADIYNDDLALVTSRVLATGDILILVGGGHGFRMLEDTILLEVKQGPYTGLGEKRRF